MFQHTYIFCDEIKGPIYFRLWEVKNAGCSLQITTKRIVTEWITIKVIEVGNRKNFKLIKKKTAKLRDKWA